MTTINIEKSELIAMQLFKNLKNKNIHELTLEDVWYWNVPVESEATFKSESDMYRLRTRITITANGQILRWVNKLMVPVSFGSVT